MPSGPSVHFSANFDRREKVAEGCTEGLPKPLLTYLNPYRKLASLSQPLQLPLQPCHRAFFPTAKTPIQNPFPGFGDEGEVKSEVVQGRDLWPQ